MSDIVERLRASYEFNGVEMLETAADTIIRLTAENDLLANDRDGYVQLLTDQNTRLTAEVERLRAYALKAFTVVEFCCGEGFLLSYPHYDCDDLIMEGVDLLKVESSEEARAALGFTPLHKETSND